MDEGEWVGEVIKAIRTKLVIVEESLRNYGRYLDRNRGFYKHGFINVKLQ